ncbi:MAG: hypothetical protein GY953_19160 [bacterium]|nr:hypothetical protein [bacterium]
MLTYHLFNYTVACKPCNQAFKSNYFPIAGPRNTGGGDPRRIKAEKPYLLYPIGNVDADPERIVRYDGVLAVPAPKSGHRHRRALATIVFFGLNQREEHLAERAEKISHLYVSLGSLNNSDAFARRHAHVIVDHLCSARSSHTNCMRSFRKLYESEPARARRVVEHVQRYLKTTS